MRSAVLSIADIERVLSASSAGRKCKTALVALIFSPVGADITDSHILPRFSYFDVRSANHIDFFMAGFAKRKSGSWAKYPDARPVGSVTFEGHDKVGWKYSDIAFDSIRNEVEEATKHSWAYSGESDILLVNAVTSPKNKRRSTRLSFDQFVAIDLWQAIEDGAVPTPSRFLESLIKYVETTSLKGVWEWSDSQGIKKGGGALVDGVLSLIPEPLRKLWKEGKHFAVKKA